MSSYGQELISIKSRLSLLEFETYFKLDSTGISELTVPDFFCISNKSDESEIIKLENSWHVQDLNNDGLKDLIYSGSCLPYSQTAIFLNNKKGFKLVYNYPGDLISIEKKSSEIKINVLKSSCGCDYYSDLIEVSINHKSEIQVNTISFHFETKIMTSEKLDSKIVSGILRRTSILNDKIKKDACTDDTMIGNQIEIIENQPVIILSEEKNWFLVLIKKSDTYSVVGWINK